MSNETSDHRPGVTGLLTKGLLLTTQRWVDIAMIFHHFTQQSIFYTRYWVLLGSIILSTLLLAYTAAHHRSAFRGIPHGHFGTVIAILQLAAVWEMMDKILAPASTSDFELEPSRPSTSDNQNQNARQPPIPKGSRGEYLMRGLRKLAIVSLPHYLVSVIINASWFCTEFATVDQVDPVTLVLPISAMVLGLSCLAMSCADLSLYVWVDDFFVQENKKIVTLHYGIEVWNRIPTLVVFHQTFSSEYEYWPTGIYVVVDLICLTVLKSASFRTGLSSRRKYGVILLRFFKTVGWSIPLLVVNFHFFDPGLSFAYINRGYYVLRIFETAILLGCMRSTIIGVDDVSRSYWAPFLDAEGYAALYVYTTVASTLLMALMVWVIIPNQRNKLFGPDDARPLVDDAEIPEYTGGSSRNMSTAYCHRPLLDRCGDILEMLWVLSKISSSRVRRQIIGEVVTNLRLASLPLEGSYVSSANEHIRIESSDKLITVFITQKDAETCSIHHGVLESATLCFLLRQDQNVVLTGIFDGAEIRWSDNQTWVRTEQGEVEGLRAVLPLLLPQLVWALRWEEPITDSRVYVEKNPLLWFLIMYGILLKDASFCTSLYWHLYSHGNQSANEDPNVTESYSLKRVAFVRALVSNEQVFIDERGRRQSPGPETEVFRKKVLAMLAKQRNMWKQKMRLLHAAHGSQYTHHERTHRVKALLRRIMRQEEASDGVPRSSVQLDESALSLQENAHTRAPTHEVAGARRVTLEDVLLEQSDLENTSVWASPLDPDIEFTGAEDVEVGRSANAPIVVSMRTQCSQPLLPMQDVPSFSDTVESLEETEDEPGSLVKYMIKSGDDLRQDALILQFMALFEKVWRERLSSSAARWLELAPYKVLAITPYAGYVKFVPHSYPLSHVLRASGRGCIVGWLREHHPPDMSLNEVMDRFCGSVAAYTVATYVLGIGDRHLDNLMLTTEGRFFHVDFGFVLGDDPKPFAPRLRLPREVVEALQFTGAPSARISSDNDTDPRSRLSTFLDLCQQAFIALRQTASLWTMLLKLTAAAGGCGVKKLKSKSGRSAALARMNERLQLHLNESDAVAAEEFAKIVITESEAVYPTLLDKLHSVVQFWH